MTDPAARTPAGQSSLAERLLALSREAHELRQHETAYHALTAAMHAADVEGDVQTLVVIRREAETQIAYIDRMEPDHRLATRSAARHSHPGVYVLLARQAHMHMQMHDTRELPGLSGWHDAPRDAAPAHDPPEPDDAK